MSVLEMSQNLVDLGVPTSEKVLRDLARNVSKALPRFAEEEPEAGVKQLHDILNPILETANISGIAATHRAAASNALCAVVEACHLSTVDYARNAILEDKIWLRLLDFYLERSDEAKGKSMRQLLLLLTNIVTKTQNERAEHLRAHASRVFLDIICARQDRVKVKPALQGLAHFLLRDTVSISQLLTLHADVQDQPLQRLVDVSSWQDIFKAFLAWIVHHDTSLSAGHLVKNFLLQARRLPDYSTSGKIDTVSPFWIKPVVAMLREWPDRIQEFKTHVFPHCFLPNIDEFVRFLSYVQLNIHVRSRGSTPDALLIYQGYENGLTRDEEYQIILAALETGKELTIIRDQDMRTKSGITIQSDAMYIPDDVFGEWMSQQEPEVRLAGMFLSVYSTSVTRAFTSGALESLRGNIIHLHTDTDANFRREVHGYTQRLFDRLRASTATLSKSAAKSKIAKLERLDFPQSCFGQFTMLSKQSHEDSLLSSLHFVAGYVRFLESELRSTASYQRRITALQSLTIVLRSGVDPGIEQSSLSKSAQGQLHWAHKLRIANPKLIRLLLDLIIDPFDDIRSMAVSVLQLCQSALPINERETVFLAIKEFISRAEVTMLRTGRADQADGVARSYSLLYSLADQSNASLESPQRSSAIGVFAQLETQLMNTLDVARKNLAEAVDGRPVHGTFSALRYIIDQDSFYSRMADLSEEEFSQYKAIHDNIVSHIESLWDSVQSVLCADAPEGHVPDDMEEETSLDTKEILSYSWRGLKEASVLLRTIVSKCPIGNEDRDLVSPDTFERLGQLCFTQLLDLRHRGAFSTVSQTFAAFCRRCITSNISSIHQLPNKWYLETLKSIQAKADAITRRSAGIPALMAGIIAADPKLISRAMDDLTAEAVREAQSTNIEESRLPQVHALNCIKEFFITSRLSLVSEPYMGAGLELAARTLNSSIWPIRNCSLMLFKALIERLLGSDEAQDWKERERSRTSRFSYSNYPSLVGILTNLLNPEGPLKQSIEQAPDSGSPMDLHGAEGVFPALQILRQARPPETALEPIKASVVTLLGSPHWHLRDMAARTVVSLQHASQLRATAFVLLQEKSESHNLHHGKLLTVKYMLRKWLHDPNQLDAQNIEDAMKQLSNMAKFWFIRSNCPFIRSAFLDIVSLCGLALLQRSQSACILPAWESLTRAVLIGPQYALQAIGQVGDSLLRQSLAQVYVIDRVILRDSTLDILVNKHYQGLGEALSMLASEDPDSCSTALETLDKILKLSPTNGLTIPLDLILAHIHAILTTSEDAEVLSKAQMVLADSLTNPHYKAAFFQLLTAEQILATLHHLESQCLNAPPSNMQSALQLLGFFLDHAYRTLSSHRYQILKATSRYIRLLRMTIIDTNPFDMRFAAVSSVCALQHLLSASTTAKRTSPLILALSFILYDLLNDDDDEIRDAAARAAGTLLRAQSPSPVKDTVPLVAANNLTKWLYCTFSTSPDLATEAIRRLTNTPSPAPLLETPFAETFAQARKEDTALFATEKQNLYKDDTLDAIVWARVLSHIPSAASLGQHVMLKRWVLEALDMLTETAKSERDGPLGWSSKPEVFALGVQVICAAEVMVKWGERRVVLVALQRFVDAGRESEVHGVWMEKAEGVLARAVVWGLRTVEGTLGDIACGKVG